jgi:hypothetical protein
MKQVIIQIPKCDCGCEGDLLIRMEDGIVSYMICDCCGCNFDGTKERECTCPEGGPDCEFFDMETDKCLYGKV